MKEPGLFFFNLNDVFYYFGSHRNIKVIESDCDQRWFPMEFIVNNGNTNIELIYNMGISTITPYDYISETEKHNFEHGSWSFVVVAP